MDAEELRRRDRRHHDHAPRARELAQPRHRASARRRHREEAGSEPRPGLRSRGRGADLQGVRSLLFGRARRAAGATGGHGGVLRLDRQRGLAPLAARNRLHRAQRPHRLSLRPELQRAGQIGRSRRLLSAQDHDAGRGGARHCARAVGLCALSRRQDRHVARRERRLVHRLHQRRHHRRVDGLRQRRRQAPHAWWRRHRRRRGGADLRAGDPGGLGQRRAQGPARPAVGGSQAPAFLLGRKDQRRVPAHRCPRQGHRHPVQAGVTRELVCQQRRR